MSKPNHPFRAREADLLTLRGHFNGAQGGEPQWVRLRAPEGGGRRALMNAFINDVQKTGDEVLVWRVACQEAENGLQWLMRMYGSLMAALNSDVLLSAKVRMRIHEQVPKQPERVQQWLNHFIESIEEARATSENGDIKLTVSKDNPLLALAEITWAIATCVPIVLDLQRSNVVQSLGPALFLEALQIKSELRSSHLFVCLYEDSDRGLDKATTPIPMLDFLSRKSSHTHVVDIAPWGASEVSTYLQSCDVECDAEGLTRLANGKPTHVIELVDWLQKQDRLQDDLTALSLWDLIPTEIDPSELTPENKDTEGVGPRKFAGADDAAQVRYLAALLGQAFPASLLADIGQFDRDSIDDLLDAMSPLIVEQQFLKNMNTWIYKFPYTVWREGILQEHEGPEGIATAKQVAGFMERFLLSRGPAFVVHASRIYARHGELKRAAVVRAVGLGHDAVEIWMMAQDFIRSFPGTTWPTNIQKIIYLNLIDRLIRAKQLGPADTLHEEASLWSADMKDRELTAWLLFTGSKLDGLKNDIVRGRDRAKDALSLYQRLERPLQVAEILNHLAQIELVDKKPEKAKKYVKDALNAAQTPLPDGTMGVMPNILATSEHLLGNIARQENKLEDAMAHFQKANGIAGQLGIAPLALDAGLAYGETLATAKQFENAVRALSQVQRIAQSINSPSRERNACELLSQSHAALGHFDQAQVVSERALELANQLKLQGAIPINLYNLGFFHFAQQHYEEALEHLDAAMQTLPNLETHILGREVLYLLGFCHLHTERTITGVALLHQALPLLEAAKDHKKVCATHQRLAIVAEKQDNVDQTRQHLQAALDAATVSELKPQIEELKKHLARLEVH